jgi:hypothetical protein
VVVVPESVPESPPEPESFGVVGVPGGTSCGIRSWMFGTLTWGSGEALWIPALEISAFFPFLVGAVVLAALNVAWQTSWGLSATSTQLVSWRFERRKCPYESKPFEVPTEL